MSASPDKSEPATRSRPEHALGEEGVFFFLEAGGANVIYGGDGNDAVIFHPKDGQPDKFYCGKGKDTYGLDGAAQMANDDYVDSSCEKKVKVHVPKGPA